MKRLTLFASVILFTLSSFAVAEENIRRLGTWNMKWLGASPGSALDAVESAKDYANYINSTGATLFALQEVVPSHSKDGKARCYMLDNIVAELNNGEGSWKYFLDQRNGFQRLAVLYDDSEWTVTTARTIWPGSSYRGLRRPLLAHIQAKGDNAELEFDLIVLHMKAFPDAEDRRTEQFDELSEWLASSAIDSDVIMCGDTNIYFGQSQSDDGLGEVGYKSLYDGERTSIHDGKLSQVFDRFYSSAGAIPEINSAKAKVGNKALIDSHKELAGSDIIKFDENVSDHFPVTLAIDVSEERN